MTALASVTRKPKPDSKWHTIELNPMDSPQAHEWNFLIPYVYMSKKYGRAEFDVCVKWRYYKISDVWIVPRQQETEVGRMYHIRVQHGSQEVSFGDGRVWRTGRCLFHKAIQFSVYVPDNTNSLHISLLSSVVLAFRNHANPLQGVTVVLQ